MLPSQYQPGRQQARGEEWAVLTGHSETPEVKDISQPDQYRQPRHREAREQHHVPVLLVRHLLAARLHALDGRDRPADRPAERAAHPSPEPRAAAAAAGILRPPGIRRVAAQGLEVLQAQAADDAVGVGDVVHDLDGLLVLALVHEELGALAEAEDEAAQEEDGQRDAPQREEEVPPAHVVVPAAARRAGLAARVVAARQRVGLGEVGRARHGGDEAEGDGAAEDHADRLEDGEGGQEEALVLRDELERDGRVDRDVAAHAEADEGREDQERCVVA